jgi:hypothetical protein
LLLDIYDDDWSNADWYLIKPDGTGLRKLTSGPGYTGNASWQTIFNKAPITTNDSLSVTSGNGTADVLANDTDEETLSGLNLTIATSPSHGSAVIAEGKVKYTATTGYSGADSLTYRICDSFSSDQKCATGVLGVTVTAASSIMVQLDSIGTVTTVDGVLKYYYTGHTPTFSGTATPGATITVEIHSDPIILTTIANGAGHWSVTPTQSLPNGEHTVTITAAKDGTTTTLSSYILGINVGLAATGVPIWPLLLIGVVGGLVFNRVGRKVLHV